jgi:Arc/MetJ-type ribon-helix-helix transcriptional regulator
MLASLTGSMTRGHIGIMSVAKVTISIDQSLLKRVDRLVKSRAFPNRSNVIQQAIEEKMARINSTRLARECAKLHPAEEQSLADEGLAWEHALAL